MITLGIMTMAPQKSIGIFNVINIIKMNSEIRTFRENCVTELNVYAILI